VTTQAVIEPPPAAAANPPWSLATRILFRFCVVYFTLFALSTQIITSLIVIPNVDTPSPASLPPLRQIVGLAAAHLFHLAPTPAFFAETGSGDRPADWILAFCLLIFAVLGTALWSILDRRRPSYIALRKWFWLFFRFCLAGQMLTYALVKIVPLQMPYPPLTRLLEPFGNFSPMGVLWYSVGASPAYEIFAGSAEMLGGLLLLIPRTRTLGALICLADMTQVFVLNMTYDVPVKLFSFHLILMSLLLLAPDFRRLADFFFLRRPVAPPVYPPLFQSPRWNRLASLLQVVFVLWLIGTGIYGDRDAWHEYGGGAPKPALYGIWNVESLTVDGKSSPPLLTDTTRWRRVVFDSRSRTAFQQMDDKDQYFRATIDPGRKTVALRRPGDAQIQGTLTYAQPSPDKLTLDGTLNQHSFHAELALCDRSQFMLVSRGFRWVQQYPYNH